MVLEQTIKKSILKEYGNRDDLLLFQNDQMTAWLKGPGGQLIPYRCGLGVGTGDIIFGHSILITPAHVGRRFLQFGNAEIKRPGGERTTLKQRLEAQKAFIREVLAMGGCAGMVDNVEDFGSMLEMFS